MESLKNGELSIGDALTQIEALRQQMLQVGGVDVENSAVEAVVQAMQKEELTPELAVQKVIDISAGRQDRYAL